MNEPTDIERVYLNCRTRWERHYLSAVRRRNTRAMKEAQDYIDNATRHLAMCAHLSQRADTRLLSARGFKLFLMDIPIMFHRLRDIRCLGMAGLLTLFHTFLKE